MSELFELPEGLSWKDIDAGDISWLRSFSNTPEDLSGYRNLNIEFDLKRESDGLVRRCKEDWYPFLPVSLEDLLEGLTFQYTDGNYGCGCNRSIFFAEAGEEPRPEPRPCETKFTIVWPEWLSKADRGEW